MTAAEYVARIRNRAKQDYARSVYTALRSGWEMPEAPRGLSYMAAQAVRMRLTELMRQETSK